MKVNKEIRNAFLILISIFVLIVFFIILAFIFNHDTNSVIYEKAKNEINTNRAGYLSLYKYLSDSTDESHPITSIAYRDGWDNIIFTIRDSLNRESNSKQVVPSFIENLNFTVGASYHRKLNEMIVNLPFANHRYFWATIIYSKNEDNIIKNKIDIGYKLCKGINEICDSHNSMIKIDSNWILLFTKHP